MDNSPYLISDDPYYCGLRARVPNFVKMAKGGGSNGHAKLPGGFSHPLATRVVSADRHHHHHHYAERNYPIAHSQSSQIYGHHVVAANGKRPHIMYHARSFESGLGKNFVFILFQQILLFSM